ncbi:MAG TPA: response regulator transcription factor [Deltaproteobacteria bacterium]|nr:response regulator transcription factor [Deltaproteobacteria bacterium]HPR53669.1 response regulator transcription factor [Deltaproteobacteria bacterium]HXK47185.1 response regulator transcription factor [Deltaproteobacteria bacterium]
MRILVIEDEKKVAEFIRRGLREEGYAVDLARDGDEGLDMAEGAEYDLVLLDIMLPKKDGFRVCEAVRSKGLDMPILMLTARDDVKDKVRGLDAGADDYLTKPFAFEELLARIRALVRKRYQRTDARLKVADLVLDPVMHRVTRNTGEIRLTAKEYALLEYLMLNAGTVVTRTMISEHVWDINFDTFTNVIDVYISYLRKKIDRDSETRLIHTIKGRGYMVKEGTPDD